MNADEIEKKNNETKDEQNNEQDKEIIFAPPIQLSTELKKIIEEKFSEYYDLKAKMEAIKQAEQEKNRILEEKKKLTKVELSRRTAEYTLKSLHKVAQNPDILRYLNEIGNLVVFETDRGYGKNSIIFTKRDQAEREHILQKLCDQRGQIENSTKRKSDQEIEIEKIDNMLQKEREELEYMKHAGGIIILYIGENDRSNIIDYYSRDKKNIAVSLALLRVYFGSNKAHEDLFHKFNTPELIMKLIHENIQKGASECEIVKLKDNLKNNKNVSK